LYEPPFLSLIGPSITIPGVELVTLVALVADERGRGEEEKKRRGEEEGEESPGLMHGLRRLASLMLACMQEEHFLALKRKPITPPLNCTIDRLG
jgi:hypothetical protein